MKPGRYNLYVNAIRAKKVDQIFRHLVELGVIPAESEPRKNLALIFDYVLNLSIEEIRHEK